MMRSMTRPNNMPALTLDDLPVVHSVTVPVCDGPGYVVADVEIVVRGQRIKATYVGKRDGRFWYAVDDGVIGV